MSILIKVFLNPVEMLSLSIYCTVKELDQGNVCVLKLTTWLPWLIFRQHLLSIFLNGARADEFWCSPVGCASSPGTFSRYTQGRSVVYTGVRWLSALTEWWFLPSQKFLCNIHVDSRIKENAMRNYSKYMNPFCLNDVILYSSLAIL